LHGDDPESLSFFLMHWFIMPYACPWNKQVLVCD